MFSFCIHRVLWRFGEIQGFLHFALRASVEMTLLGGSALMTPVQVTWWRDLVAGAFLNSAKFCNIAGNSRPFCCIGGTRFVSLERTLKGVRDFQMPIGEFDLPVEIENYGLFVSPAAARFWARIIV
jgi:hypothetical protein